jgi:HSP20 family protein
MSIERYQGRYPAYWGPFFGLRGLQDEMNRLFSDFYGETSEKGLASISPALDLLIKGEKKEEKEEKEESRYYMERTYGSFSRSVSLPSRIQEDKIKASYKDGVLYIDLPRAEEEKPKEIKVAVG